MPLPKILGEFSSVKGTTTGSLFSLSRASMASAVTFLPATAARSSPLWLATTEKAGAEPVMPAALATAASVVWAKTASSVFWANLVKASWSEPLRSLK